jgi:hypothetical protein
MALKIGEANLSGPGITGANSERHVFPHRTAPEHEDLDLTGFVGNEP